MAQAQILDMLCLEKVQKWINQAHEMPVVRPEQAEVAYCLRYGTTLPPTTMLASAVIRASLQNCTQAAGIQKEKVESPEVWYCRQSYKTGSSCSCKLSCKLLHNSIVTKHFIHGPIVVNTTNIPPKPHSSGTPNWKTIPQSDRFCAVSSTARVDVPPRSQTAAL